MRAFALLLAYALLLTPSVAGAQRAAPSFTQPYTRSGQSVSQRDSTASKRIVTGFWTGAAVGLIGATLYHVASDEGGRRSGVTE